MAQFSKDGSTPAPAGRRVAQWCAAIPCSKPSFYNFVRREPDLIKTVKIGSMTIVLTSPVEYLAAQAAARV